jgi:hypothetical protein
MTSWPKRIGNVATVIDSLLNQSTKPDIVQINLSLDEFPNKEEDFPEGLKTLLKANPEVCIEWVKGNDGVFKKIIPTLKKHYGEEYFLVSVDDDWIYRNDYIEMMVDYLFKYDADSFCLSTSKVIGNRIIYKSSCFRPDFWEKLTPEVVLTRIDDSYIEHYLSHYHKKMACFRPSDTPDITKRFNPVYPNSGNTETGQYSAGDIARAIRIISSVKF